MNLHNITDAATKLYQQVFQIPTPPTEEEELLNAIKKAHSDVERAHSLFNEATDFAVSDYAAYNILAAQAKYSYLIKLAKEKNIHL